LPELTGEALVAKGKVYREFSPAADNVSELATNAGLNLPTGD
jgi:hypothetical protein